MYTVQGLTVEHVASMYQQHSRVAEALQMLGHLSRGCSAMQSCQTTFLQQAQQTPGLDFLVQAIQRGNLVLPAAGSGATSFAPTNAAFTDMLQTLSVPHTRHRCITWTCCSPLRAPSLLCCTDVTHGSTPTPPASKFPTKTLVRVF